MRAATRRLLVRTAARAEQEVRAHPRLYDGFYKLVVAAPPLRAAAGRVKDAVRGGSAGWRTAPPLDTPVALQRRLTSIQSRLAPRVDR